MKRTCLSLSLPLLLAVSAMPALAGKPAVLRSPASGVLCDRNVCADDKGISRELTEKYLGKRAATQSFSHGDSIQTEFTFATGTFCDVKERLCRRDRYFGADGKRSGTVDRKYSELLFGRMSFR
jgi:hypothetical protein